MRVTLLGHASLLIETSDLTVLTDPTFGDIELDGIAEFCPRRALDVTALPDIDLIYISHLHTDHFDIDSLAHLRNKVETVIAPNDPFVLDGLAQLGFETIQPIKDGQALRFGETRLLITPSRFKVPEHGLLVSDPDAVVWNQVDTLCEPEWLPNLRTEQIDLHIANFSPLSWYHVLVNGPSSFPHDVYREQFEVIRAARAKLIVPGSSGLKFRAPYEHMNRYWFPVRHERFAEDIRRALGTETAVLNPGDVVEIIDHVPKVHRQAAHALVRATDASTDAFHFNPTSTLPALIDHNQLAAALPDLDTAVTEVLGKIAASLADPRKISLLERIRPWNVRMQISVQFPDRVQEWTIDFSSSAPVVRQGKAIDANYFFEATASGLHDVERGLAWDRFFYFEHRAFHTVYMVRAEGVFTPEAPAQGRLGAGGVPSPHELFFALWEPSPGAWIRRRVERALAST